MSDVTASEPEQEPGVARDPHGLVEAVDHLEAKGFDQQMVPLEGGDIRCGSCRAINPAGAFQVVEMLRLEGASDPSDMAAVVALVCPACGAKGTAALKYGPEAGAAEADVLLALQDPEAVNTEPRSPEEQGG